MPDQGAEEEPMSLAAKLWGAGLALMLLASIVTLATHITLSRDSMPTVAIGSVEGVERLGGIDIPENARLVNARLRHSMIDLDPLAWAILEMPRDAARQMFKSPPFAEGEHDARPVSDAWGRFGDERIEGWHPDEAEVWMGAMVGQERRQFWHINALADLDEEPARVYMLLER